MFFSLIIPKNQRKMLTLHGRLKVLGKLVFLNLQDFLLRNLNLQPNISRHFLLNFHHFKQKFRDSKQFYILYLIRIDPVPYEGLNRLLCFI